MADGNIIFLNGTSSAGKTTLALALQALFDEPYQHMALDQFRDGLPAKYRGLNSPPETTGARGLNVVPVTDGNNAHTAICFGEDGQRLLKGMRRAIAEISRAGNHVIIDDIILDPAFLDDYLDVMHGLPLYFVGVRCPIEVINERESSRLGRFPGTAEGHLHTCHAHDCYDVEVDTSAASPDECAASVVARVNAGPPDAFDRLRQRNHPRS